MTAIIMDGKKLAGSLQENYKQAVKKLRKSGVTPKLSVITVGNDPASKVYVGQKQKKSQQIGIEFDWITLEESIKQETLLEIIHTLNEDKKVSGILVQLPLPRHLDDKIVTEAINPSKDVDGFHPYNLGKLVAKQTTLIPCTPRGVIRLLKHYKIDITGKDVTVVGRSQIVGMPLSILLTHENATVTVTHSKTKQLDEHLKRADIIVAATGNPHFIKEEHVKDNAIVIDIGINRMDDGSLAGDVDFEAVLDKTFAITPVPGGVGPMTVAMLMEQTIVCACLNNNLNPEDYQEAGQYD